MRELEEEVEELTAQLKSLRDSLEQETLSKVDLQNNLQSLKEKLAFDRRIHEEVIIHDHINDYCYHVSSNTHVVVQYSVSCTSCAAGCCVVILYNHCCHTCVTRRLPL